MSRRNYGKGAYRAGGRGQYAPGGAFVQRVVGGDVLVSSPNLDVGLNSDPHRFIRARINEALDPTKAPSKPKTFAEMTDEEKAEMRRLYERKRGGTP